MKSKNVRKNSKVDETERVKLYKTHRGWCSSLSRFWTFLKADSIDEDDETSYEDYLKAIATIGTIAGATMLMPTTAMADSTQLQKTMDSRRSMAIGLSSNSQSESTYVRIHISSGFRLNQHFSFRVSLDFNVGGQLNK
ncbi:serine-rich glycoprotein adhesin [Limosilactobacillus mucosae]|uniref:serine-rich glycoprotein adhesin n=1 Tax=Limosilactobacillus mucosae TaxID=97478 RepID=UPI003A4D6651